MYNHDFNPLPDSIDLGFISVQFYALFILMGILIALWLGYREVKKLDLNPDDLTDGFSYGLILSILGARFYYVIYEWDSYKSNVISALYIWNGGLAIHGAIIAVAIFLYFYTKKRAISIWKYIEVLVPGFLLAQGIGRWGNFMNQEAHGGPITGGLDAQREFLSNTLKLPEFIVNQMYLYGPDGLQYYHPTFFYESMWNIVGFLIMFFVLRNIRKYWIGEALSFYLIWYSFGRYFIEGMRTDSLYVWGTDIRMAQLISIVLAVVGLVFFVVRRINEWYPISYKDTLEGVEQEVEL